MLGCKRERKYVLLHYIYVVMKKIMLFLSFLGVACAGRITDDGLPGQAAALQEHSLRFDTVGNSYYSGGLIGNGRLGASIYGVGGDTLCWELGSTEVVDHRQGTGTDDGLYNKCRLPIGKLLLPLGENPSNLITDLYKAEVRGEAGRVKWKSWAPAHLQVLLVELSGDEELPEFLFRPEISQSPRAIYSKAHSKNMPEGYRPNPDPLRLVSGEYHINKQPLLAGGEYTTVWRVTETNEKKVLWLSIAYSRTDTATERKAIADIEAAMAEPLETVRKRHTAWWSDFYARSYVSVGEKKFDSFFWNQKYKLGSATRSDALPIDLMGPWYHNRTPWPAIWWNLNIQLTYSPLFALNHSDLALPLCDMLDANVRNLMQNVPGPWQKEAAAIGRTSSYDCLEKVGDEHGLLLWTLFYYRKYCLYENDGERLEQKLFPLLKLSVNYYRYLLSEGADGHLHMPVSFSPEYARAADCNFELALLRWGCETLVTIDRALGINDPLLPEWQRILEKLAPYPADEDGFLIGNGVKLTSTHRHYSHLLMIYPLSNYPLDTEENREMAIRSMRYWLSFPTRGYTGYTYSGASSMYTLLGDGENARKHLENRILPCITRPVLILTSIWICWIWI